MIKVDIKKQGQITNSARFETQELATAWLNQQVALRTFGRPERWVQNEAHPINQLQNEANIANAIATRTVIDLPAVEESIDEETGEVIPAREAVSHVEYKLAADYTVEQTDLTAQLLQASRNAKLEQLRQLREPLLKEVDNMVNEVTLGDRSDVAAIKAYRNELLALTDDYKKVNGDAKAAIDSLNLATMTLPTKP